MNYLAKAGRVFGPFNDIDFAMMKQKGELDRFSWLWNEAREAWEPLDPAPARPRPTPPQFNRQIDAIAHDFRQVISGVLDTVSESGCNLVCRDHEGGAVFGKESELLVSLLDPRTGQSMNVRAKLASTSRANGHWNYRLQWDQCPALLMTGT